MFFVRAILFLIAVYFTVNIIVASWSSGPAFAVVAGIVCFFIFMFVARVLGNVIEMSGKRFRRWLYEREYGR